MRHLSILVLAMLMTAGLATGSPAQAKIPHTVDFNRGESDNFTGRVPSYMVGSESRATGGQEPDARSACTCGQHRQRRICNQEK